MTPRIYMAGACARLPDLGVAWRRKAASAIEAAGGVPVYPPDIADVAGGFASVEKARERWEDEPIDSRIACLQEMASCDASLCLFDGRHGAGTAAELAFAAWLPGRFPVVYAQDETQLAAKAAEAVAKAKESRR